MNKFLISYAFVALSLNAATDIVVDPTTTLSIGGVSKLDRTQHFSIATGGTDFGRLSEEQFDYYINDLGICFGRHVNLLSTWKWDKSIQEDSARPGYLDIQHLAANVKASDGKNPERMKRRFPDNLDVIGTENFHTKTWPTFMETKVMPEDKTGHHPIAVNVDAAAEALIAYLNHGFNDWTRPKWFEGLNEPDWFFAPDEDFAKFHLKALEYARAADLDMKVGGPCFSTGQFFRNNYQHLTGFLGKFIDNTEGKLDFYSFHPYNYVVLDEATNRFVGRYTSGLPFDGVLDGYANFTINKYQRRVPLVISEHGSYVEGGEEEKAKIRAYAEKTFSETGWELEKKRRSIDAFLMANGAISYTMTFMGHPHIVEKSVPYILLNTNGWKPDHYSALMVSENYEVPAKNFHENEVVDYYKFFKGVEGRRIQSFSPDPDIQHHAFVNDNQLFLLFSNLAETSEELKLNIGNAGKIKDMLIRRHGQNANLTPYFTETVSDLIDSLVIQPDESIAVVVNYSKQIQEKSQINEILCYGNKVAKELIDGATETFSVRIPHFDTTEYGIVRVSVARPNGTDRKLSVTLNGTQLNLPMEDCADRIDATNRFANQYGSLKFLKVEKSLLREENTIEVNFPDGKPGGIGSVVIRAGQM